MYTQLKCKICGDENSECESITDSILEYKCKVCGKYRMTMDAYDDISCILEDEFERRKLSACVRKSNIRYGDKQILTFCVDKNINLNFIRLEEAIDELFPKRVQDQFDEALLNLCKMTQYPGHELNLDLKTDYPVLMVENFKAASFILNELQELRYIKDTAFLGGSYRIEVIGNGFKRAQELEDELGREESKQAFVAMWFDDTMNDTYDKGIKPAIEACGFKSFKISEKETNNDITDEIIAEIRRSRFIVSDFTGQRGGVYFESGFAMGLGLPVIWMVKEDEIKKVHFDTRQFAHIVWTGCDDLKERLINRIRATIPGAK